MAILSSVDGKLYELPDDECARYEVPADRVKDVMARLDQEAEANGDVMPYATGGGGGGPAVIIHVSGSGVSIEDMDGPDGDEVEPYGRRFRFGWHGGHNYGYHKPWGHHYGGHHPGGYFWKRRRRNYW